VPSKNKKRAKAEFRLARLKRGAHHPYWMVRARPQEA
jgi:hypothetical protein